MECKLKNITLYYEIIGSGKPILMLHGYYSDHRLMKGCMEPLFNTESDWQRIYLDLPGMGKTKGEDWITCSDQILEIVFEFIDKVIPDKRFLVVGESYGGYLARGVIYKRPEIVDGMLLICPVIVPDRKKRILPRHAVISKDLNLDAVLSPEKAKKFDLVAVVQNEKIWNRYRDEVLAGTKVSDMPFLDRIMSTGYPLSFHVDELEKPFNKPVLILTGRQDARVGYQDALNILENFERGTFILLDKAGHNLQIEQDAIFNTTVMEWLERVREFSDKYPL